MKGIDIKELNLKEMGTILGGRNNIGSDMVPAILKEVKDLFGF